ncbi:hypothetical protein Tcan_18144 [Toxocara canis]|uniref:TGF-beta family profile domain-containing protein n=1 Tax=Toxocara canis TaxID=6265 RepID=A0A0B2VMH4_TOXCA|nr:hypothetical protein Tcan_18144 [Toxocara canis]
MEPTRHTAPQLHLALASEKPLCAPGFRFPYSSYCSHSRSTFNQLLPYAQNATMRLSKNLSISSVLISYAVECQCHLSRSKIPSCIKKSNATALLGVLDRLHAKMFATHLLSLVGNFVDIHNISFSSVHHSKNRRAKITNGGVEDCERFLGRAEFSGNSSNNGYFECCRRMVHLDFSETRLSGWGAKHPNSVKGYYCVGHCTRYGGYAFSAQTGDESFYSELMNAHASSLGLSPCCAPVRFDPLTVTVRHGTSEESTQIFNDFIVAKCGCI